MGKIVKFKNLVNSIKYAEKEIKSIKTVNCIKSELNMSKMNLDSLRNTDHTFIKELVTFANTLFLLNDKVYVQKKKRVLLKTSLFNNVFNILKNSINKCKTKTKVIIESCASEYESYASEYESCASKPFDSNNEPFVSVSNTKTWVSMLFDSDSDSKYDSCDSDNEYDLYDSDNEYDSCNSDTDSEYDSRGKTDINYNKEIINQLNNFITLRKSFLNYINKIEVLKSEIQDNIYSDLPLLKYARMNNINELLDELLDYLWNMIYGENREKNEISNIDIDMNNDIDRYISNYINIVNGS